MLNNQTSVKYVKMSVKKIMYLAAGFTVSVVGNPLVSVMAKHTAQVSLTFIITMLL